MTLLSRDAIVRGLMEQGFSRAQSEAAADREIAAELRPDDVAQLDAAAARRAPAASASMATPAAAEPSQCPPLKS